MTSLIVFCSLIFAAGLLLGAYTESVWEDRAARRDAAEEQADTEADDYLGQLTGLEDVQRREAMARRTRPVYRQRPDPLAIQMRPPRRRRTSTAAFLNPPQIGGQIYKTPPEIAHEPFVNAAGYFQGLDRLMAGITSTSREIDEETGQFVGQEDDYPFTVHTRQALALTRPETDEEFDARMTAGYDQIRAWVEIAAAGAPYQEVDKQR